MGQRYLETGLPLLFVETLNNITFNNITIRSFTRSYDANMFSVYMDGATCSLVKADGIKKYFNFTNVYISSDSKDKSTSTSIEIWMNQNSDFLLRPFFQVLENVT